MEEMEDDGGYCFWVGGLVPVGVVLCLRFWVELTIEGMVGR